MNDSRMKNEWAHDLNNSNWMWSVYTWIVMKNYWVIKPQRDSILHKHLIHDEYDVRKWQKILKSFSKGCWVNPKALR